MQIERNYQRGEKKEELPTLSNGREQLEKWEIFLIALLLSTSHEEEILKKFHSKSVEWVFSECQVHTSTSHRPMPSACLSPLMQRVLLSYNLLGMDGKSFL